MIRQVIPGPRSGRVTIPASKSRAHRLLICAALYGNGTFLSCNGISRDIQATMDCLASMGSETKMKGDCLSVRPITKPSREHICLPCGESGSTLRFLLPVVGALGMTGEFQMEGRLSDRPLQPLWNLLAEHGMKLQREGKRLSFSGQLMPGEYQIPGNISSQFVSGLLFALPRLNSESVLIITGDIESADYIRMTEEALWDFGVHPGKHNERCYLISPAESVGRSAVNMTVESDWSSAAFFLSLGALSEKGITVQGMNLQSSQGDQKILEILKRFGAGINVKPEEIFVRKGSLHGIRIDASDIPDLVPVLAAVASTAEGKTIVYHAERLRLKESDRLKTTTEMLKRLGADVQETEDGMIIHGKPCLEGGAVSSYNDHRIAMSAAVAASVCKSPVIIEGSESTEKSFPGFWNLLNSLEERSEKS